VVGCILVWVLVGFLVFAWLFIWSLVRNIKGLLLLEREPADPRSRLVAVRLRSPPVLTDRGRAIIARAWISTSPKSSAPSRTPRAVSRAAK
jgi:hypothetical protein